MGCFFCFACDTAKQALNQPGGLPNSKERTVRARDKRAMRGAHNRARWADAWAPIKDEAEIYESAPDWWLDLYGEPQSDDQAWRDAIASANGRSNEINGNRG